MSLPPTRSVVRSSPRLTPRVVRGGSLTVRAVMASLTVTLPVRTRLVGESDITHR
jgi:hypothetical protein